MSVPPGHHNLSVYDDDSDLSERAAPFLEAAVEADEAVIAVVDQRKWPSSPSSRAASRPTAGLPTRPPSTVPSRITLCRSSADTTRASIPTSYSKGRCKPHPLGLGEAWHDNAHYHDPAQVVRAHTPEVAALPDLRPLPLPSDATAFRRTLLHEMTADGVPAPEANNLLVAAGEILANAQRHGRAPPDCEWAGSRTGSSVRYPTAVPGSTTR